MTGSTLSDSATSKCALDELEVLTPITLGHLIRLLSALAGLRIEYCPRAGLHYMSDLLGSAPREPIRVQVSPAKLAPLESKTCSQLFPRGSARQVPSSRSPL